MKRAAFLAIAFSATLVAAPIQSQPDVKVGTGSQPATTARSGSDPNLSASARNPNLPGSDPNIVHVLNRIGFGARPGDVERVRAMGLAKYIDAQLTPDRIPDTAMASRLAGFETLGLSSRTIASEYYVPAQMARRQAKLADAKNAAKKDAASAATTEPPREPRTPEEMEQARK